MANMAHKPPCPSIDVLATRFEAHVNLIEERRKNDDERRVNLAEQLKLQAKEYERRMFDLNHAHQLAEEKNAEYVIRETFYSSIREITQKHEQLQKLVYVGLGILLAINAAVVIGLNIWTG